MEERIRKGKKKEEKARHVNDETLMLVNGKEKEEEGEQEEEKRK